MIIRSRAISAFLEAYTSVADDLPTQRCRTTPRVVLKSDTGCAMLMLTLNVPVTRWPSGDYNGDRGIL